MKIDRYRDDGATTTYVDDDGCYYEDAIAFIQTGILGFCLCGSPEENLTYLRDGLRYIQQKCEGDYVGIFGNERSRDFFFYACDEKGLTEHGTLIPGWLTQKGEDLLSDLDELIAGFEKECGK